MMAAQKSSAKEKAAKRKAAFEQAMRVCKPKAKTIAQEAAAAAVTAKRKEGFSGGVVVSLAAKNAFEKTMHLEMDKCRASARLMAEKAAQAGALKRACEAKKLEASRLKAATAAAEMESD